MGKSGRVELLIQKIPPMAFTCRVPMYVQMEYRLQGAVL